MTVWTAPSLHRIPEDATQTNTPVSLSAARGETVSFQIAVRASTGPLTNVTLGISELRGKKAVVIPRTAVTLYREHYVTVSKASPNWGGENQPLGAGRYADALIPFIDPETGKAPTPAALKAQPWNIAYELTQPYWVDVVVPRAALAGDYVGTYTVTTDQGSFTGKIALHVWNFTLPMRPRLKSNFAFGNGASGTHAQNKELLRHRLSPPFAPVETERELIDKYGLTCRSLVFWSNGDSNGCTAMDPPPSVAEIQAKVALHPIDLPLYNFPVDEINNCTNLNPSVIAWAQAFHKATSATYPRGIDQLITITPRPDLFDDGLGTGRSAVDIWVALPCLQQGNPNVAAALAKGDQVWSYQALVQDDFSPKFLMDYAPINFRILPGFLNAAHKNTGLLYWKVDRWHTTDPWNDVNTIGAFHESNNYPGEGMLVYPGAQAGLVGCAPSLRLKWLRDGVTDFDYIALLRDKGRGDWAEAIVKRVAPDWRGWTRDPLALEDARKQLGQELERLA